MAGAFEKNDTKKSRGPWLAVLIVSLVLLVGGAAVWFFTHHSAGPDVNTFKNTTEPTLETLQTQPTTTAPAEETTLPVTTEPVVTTTEAPETTTEPLPDNPINFDALIEQNDNAIGWIVVPGCEIDLPVMQSSPDMDDNFYLHHNLNKTYEYSGCIYIQRQNEPDFSDRVTLVYGHNMLDGTMFTNLTWFLDHQFFEEHDTFYIYTPGHILTYKIAAAISFDTRHILNNFDFSDDQVYADWIENYITNPKSYIRATREDLEVTIDDKLVILSTCLEHGDYRYLIEGVLVNDERTN